MGRTPELIENAGKIPVGQLLLGEKGLGVQVEQTTVVRMDAVASVPAIDEVEQVLEVIPQRRLVRRVLHGPDTAADLIKTRGDIIAVPGQ